RRCSRRGAGCRAWPRRGARPVAPPCRLDRAHARPTAPPTTARGPRAARTPACDRARAGCTYCSRRPSRGLLRVGVDLRRRALRVPHRGLPPAPLGAALARRRREIALAMLAPELLHAGPVPGGQHAVVVDVAERRLRVEVALAGDERPIPEDVGVVP